MTSVWPFAFAILAMFLISAPQAFAHLDHIPHYNGNEDHTEKLFIYQALEPEYAAPGEPTAVILSIQDFDGNDVKDVETMLEVYSSNGQRLEATPWTKYPIGDFSHFVKFPEIGTYQIVLSIAYGPVNSNNIDPPRGTLASAFGCNCERVVFNVHISNNFGQIFTSTIIGALTFPLAGLGIVLWLNYRNKRRIGQLGNRAELAKYAIMLAAIAGGMVHFAVYSEHGSLRLEYPIFLISAGGMQVSYGILYVLLTMSSEAGALDPRQYYRKTVILNLFGLTGTVILLGLYAYSTIVAPPLSPVGTPESISLAGILAKALEVFLVIGVVFLMRFEKKNLQERISSKT
ncbi:MAG: hypothetical protein DA330_02210 [Nitrososphaera sp.]|nr:hypothetical protein [Nitrososphaera sp.]